MFIIIVGFIVSYLVKEGKLKVNYSRKIAHFSHILSTLFINGVFLDYNISSPPVRSPCFKSSSLQSPLEVE